MQPIDGAPDQGGPLIRTAQDTALAARPPRHRTARAVFALVLREMSTTYGRSPGGYLWAVAEPVAAIALLSFAFSLAFRAPSLGDSFPLFYATGYLPYMLFHDTAGRVATAVRFSRPLMNFGAVTWADILLARFLLSVFTHVVIAILILVALMPLADLSYVEDPLNLAGAMAMASLLALGVGSLNAYLFLAFPAWERVWTVLTRPLFIVSGVFFLFEDVPHEYRDLLWFNPLFHVTGAMRAGVYATYDGAHVSPAFVCATGLGLLVLGLLLMSRHASALIHK